MTTRKPMSQRITANVLAQRISPKDFCSETTDEFKLRCPDRFEKLADYTDDTTGFAKRRPSVSGRRMVAV